MVFDAGKDSFRPLVGFANKKALQTTDQNVGSTRLLFHSFQDLASHTNLVEIVDFIASFRVLCQHQSQGTVSRVEGPFHNRDLLLSDLQGDMDSWEKGSRSNRKNR